jgi:molybdopterin converting factor subunit 1
LLRFVEDLCRFAEGASLNDLLADTCGGKQQEQEYGLEDTVRTSVWSHVVHRSSPRIYGMDGAGDVFKRRGVKDLGSRMLQSMRVRVLFFGVLKEILGGEDEVLELGQGARVGDLAALYEGRVGPQKDLIQCMAIAVNREYAKAENPLHDGDEVALLPPVSGGLR